MSTVLISGASRVIGFELARQFANDGWSVIATARDPASAAALAALPNTRVLPLEVTDAASIEALLTALDGVPIDVLIASTRPLVPGCVINVRPIGVMMMEDNSGKDEKLIAVPNYHLTKRYDKVKEYTDLPEITLQQIEHFFEHYKDLEPGKWVKIFGWKDSTVARQLIVEAIERAKSAK